MSTEYVAVILPWPRDEAEAAALLERERRNAKRRMLGDWLGSLPEDSSGVGSTIVTREVRGELEATITFTMTP